MSTVTLSNGLDPYLHGKHPDRFSRNARKQRQGKQRDYTFSFVHPGPRALNNTVPSSSLSSHRPLHHRLPLPLPPHPSSQSQSRSQSQWVFLLSSRKEELRKDDTNPNHHRDFSPLGKLFSSSSISKAPVALSPYSIIIYDMANQESFRRINEQFGGILSKPNVKDLSAEPEESSKKLQVRNIPVKGDAHLDCGESVFVCACFQVDEDGEYLVDNQSGITIDGNVYVSAMQFGICREDSSDMPACFFSKQINAKLNDQSPYIHRTTTLKDLKRGVKYMAWINASSGNNKKLFFRQRMSNLKLLKLN